MAVIVLQFNLLMKSTGMILLLLLPWYDTWSYLIEWMSLLLTDL